mmetsp:Transcript_39627/g.95327  ORF Transcript_39627/g.95327 Transcript_39627/m.95327 type:complete len:387 (+) Transcript_39627:241-1401(+)
MGGLTNESQFLEQLHIFIKRRILRRQQFIPVKNGVRPRLEHQELFRVRERQPPRAQADHGPGHDDARRGDHPRHIERIDVGYIGSFDVLICVGIAEGGALHGHEGVDRDALGMVGERRQDVQESHAVGLLLAEAEDAPAADADSRLADVGDRFETILVRAGGDDVGIVLRARVEVVVVGRQARLLQLPCLLGVQHAQCGADLEAHAVHAPHHVQNVIERVLLIPQFSPRGTHAETSRAGILRPLGRREDLLNLHRGRGLDEGLVTRALGAVRAILGTPSRLDREERALLHLGGIPVHAMRRGCAVHELVEGEGVHLGDFGFRPVVTDAGGYAAHGAGVLVVVDGIAVVDVVGMTDNGLLLLSVSSRRWRWRRRHELVDDHVRIGRK